MKKLTTCILSFIFLVNIIGAQWMLVGLLHHHHQRTWNCKRHETYVVISKNQKGLRKINDHEIVFQGKLFDVIDSKGLMLYCVADSKEDQMLEAYDQVVKSNSSTETTFQSKVVKIVTHSISDYLPAVFVELKNDHTQSIKIFDYSNALSEAFLSFFSPPPELV